MSLYTLGDLLNNPNQDIAPELKTAIRKPSVPKDTPIAGYAQSNNALLKIGLLVLVGGFVWWKYFRKSED